MNKAKQYINSKTNSILKYNSKRNNRDIVATIVYNELTDLLEYSNMSDITTPIDNEIILGCINTVNTNLYSDKPLKLEKYCEKCQDPCCCRDHSDSLLDCFLLSLELEDGTPWLLEEDCNDAILSNYILLERQREHECYGKVVCDCSKYPCNCACIATLQLESKGVSSFLWDYDTPILLEDQGFCEDEYACWIGCIDKPEVIGPIKWENNTTIQLEEYIDLLLEGDYDNYHEDDIPDDCCCSNGSCSICKK